MTAPTLVVDARDNIVPTKSAIEQAADSARARIAESGSAAPPVVTPPAVTPPPTGQVPAAPETPPAVETPKPSETPAPGAPGANDEEETDEEREAREAEEAAAAAAAQDLTVALPGRNGEEWEFKVESAEAAERLRQLRNGYLRGEQIREASAQIQERSTALEERELELDTDPYGVLLERAKESPELLENVALSILAEHWDALRERVLALEDPQELRTVKAELKATRAELQNEMREAIADQVVVKENLADVQSTVASFMPTDMNEDQQRVFFADCLRDLQQHADRLRLFTIPVHDIPTILATRLVAYGINPVEAATKAAQSAARRTRVAPPPGTRRPAGATPPVTPRTPAVPRQPPPNGKTFVASATKKAAAAVPPVGAGAPGTGALTPPKNKDGSTMSIEQTIAWHREHRGKLRPQT